MQQPYILIIATDGPSEQGEDGLRLAPSAALHLGAMVRAALATEAQVMLACAPGLRAEVCEWLSPQAVRVQERARPGSAFGLAVADLVSHARSAPSWLIWPASHPEVQSATLRVLMQGLQRQSVVLPTYRGQPGFPMGLSSGLFSELMRLNSVGDLHRLAARYAPLELEVQDPGVLGPPIRAVSPATDLTLPGTGALSWGR